MEHTKRCCRCNEIKVLYEFYRNRSQPDGKAKECKDCQRQVKNGGGYRLNGNGKVPYSADVEEYMKDYDPIASAQKHRKALLNVAERERTPTAYRCAKCGEVVYSMVPVLWCPVGEHFMRQPRERLQAGWRYTA